jgi:hypothetical protein
MAFAREDTGQLPEGNQRNELTVVQFNPSRSAENRSAYIRTPL